MALLQELNYRVRLRSAALIHNEDRLLLVEHRHTHRGDIFWTVPGGGVIGAESLEDCLKREVREEVGLEVEPDNLAYVMQQIDHSAKVHHVALYFTVTRFAGTPFVNEPEAGEGYELTRCAFLSESELNTVTAYPTVLIARYRDDRERGYFPAAALLSQILSDGAEGS
jgi:8-oxo-dGTP diphosphatase